MKKQLIVFGWNCKGMFIWVLRVLHQTHFWRNIKNFISCEKRQIHLRRTTLRNHQRHSRNWILFACLWKCWGVLEEILRLTSWKIIFLFLQEILANFFAAIFFKRSLKNFREIFWKILLSEILGIISKEKLKKPLVNSLKNPCFGETTRMFCILEKSPVIPENFKQIIY